MSNGTRPGVLLSELFSGDGPHARMAEEFLAGQCRECRGPVDPRGLGTEGGSVCSVCAPGVRRTIR